MNETVLFGVGSAIFAITVWGSVMAGGFWFGRLQQAETEVDPEPPADRV